MSKKPTFPNTDLGVYEFTRAIKAWKEDGRPADQFFPEVYGISENTVYMTARRMGITIPSNRRHDRAAVVAEQRQGDGVPVEIILARYDIKIFTLRSWAHAQGKRLRGNTKLARAAWWRAYFLPADGNKGFDLDEAFATFAGDRIAPHVGIAAYHAHVQPEQPLVWDMSDHPPRVFRVDDEDFAVAVMESEPVPPRDAQVFIGKGTTLHAVRWIERESEPEPESPDPDEILIGTASVVPGQHLVLTNKHGKEHAVEYLGLQHNGLARTKDLKTGTRRTTATSALTLNGG